MTRELVTVGSSPRQRSSPGITVLFCARQTISPAFQHARCGNDDGCRPVAGHNARSHGCRRVVLDIAVVHRQTATISQRSTLSGAPKITPVKRGYHQYEGRRLPSQSRPQLMTRTYRHYMVIAGLPAIMLPAGGWCKRGMLPTRAPSGQNVGRRHDRISSLKNPVDTQ